MHLASFFNSGALGLLLEGGIFMWPLLILLVIAVAVIIERWRSLKMLDTDCVELREEVTALLSGNKVEEALALTEKARGPVAGILANGLRKYLVLRRLGHDVSRTEEQVLKSMESYGVHIVSALERHLPILATIASVAPMIGFLGTVQGMIISFGNIVSTMGEMNIVEAAASGIKTFNYFSSVINTFVLSVEASASELVESVTVQMTLEQGAQDNPPQQPQTPHA